MNSVKWTFTRSYIDFFCDEVLLLLLIVARDFITVYETMFHFRKKIFYKPHLSMYRSPNSIFNFFICYHFFLFLSLSFFQSFSLSFFLFPIFNFFRSHCHFQKMYLVTKSIIYRPTFEIYGNRFCFSWSFLQRSVLQFFSLS